MQPPEPDEKRSRSPAREENTPHTVRADGLWEDVFSAANIARALRSGERDGGAPGDDGITMARLRGHVDAHWPEIRRQLDQGTYGPQPVRRVQIPKPGGGVRDLGCRTCWTA